MKPRKITAVFGITDTGLRIPLEAKEFRITDFKSVGIEEEMTWEEFYKLYPNQRILDNQDTKEL